MAEVLLARLDDITAAVAPLVSTASNVGTVGTGVFKQKTGQDLEFYKINPASTKVSFTLVGVDRIDLDVVEANFNIGNMGGVLAHTRISPVTSDRLLGRDTAGAGAAEEIAVGGGIEFTGGPGIQRSALTGDVTAAAGSGATTIANDAVTYAKLQNVSTNQRVLGISTGAPGNAVELTLTAILDWLGSTRGNILRRGAATWNALAPGAVNEILRLDGNLDPFWSSLTSLIDGTIGSTRGQIIFRNATVWAPLATGTAGQALTTNGAGADPSWATRKWVKRSISISSGVATGTTIMPDDDTIPQDTEGDQYMTVSHTPEASGNLLRITVLAHLAQTAGNHMSGAVFLSGTANALRSSLHFNSTNNRIISPIVIVHEYTTASGSSHTFNFRAGASAAATTTFNGESSARLHGGVLSSAIIVDEYIP